MLNFTFYSIHFTWFGSVWQTIYQIIDFSFANRFLDKLNFGRVEILSLSKITTQMRQLIGWLNQNPMSGCLDKTLYFCTVFWFNRQQVIHQKFLMKFK